MIHSGIRKFGILAAAGLVVLAVSSTPARASHGNDLIVPLAAFIAIGALAHQHHDHYRYSYHYHGHYRPHHRPYRRHSYSQGGYRAPGHKHHRNW